MGGCRLRPVPVYETGRKHQIRQLPYLGKFFRTDAGMLINIQQLQEQEHVSVDVSAQQCDLPSDSGKVVAPIHFEGELRKVEQEISIAGQITTTIELICARCLKTYQEALNDTFEVIYLPRTIIAQQNDEIELEERDLDLSFYEGDHISLTELIRDQLLLVLPVKPLCRPDCAGLCPSCGKDLNEGPCNCTHESIDPRLAALQQLLPKDNTVK
jgi:uncharacterized protein